MAQGGPVTYSPCEETAADLGLLGEGLQAQVFFFDGAPG